MEEKKPPKKRGLGQGLDALLKNYNPPDETVVAADSPSRIKTSNLNQIDIDLIDVNPWQPRTEFEKRALEDLAENIKTHGLIQPITVRQTDNGRYQVIAGERRLRAFKLLDRKEIPAYIRTANDMEMLIIGLIENIQREDLNPIEIALSFQRLMVEGNLSQEDVAIQASKSRSVVTNYLRLLKLCLPVQAAIVEGKITMGHAKMLATIEDEQQQRAILDKIVDEELSVRQVEELMRKYNRSDDKLRISQIGLPQHFQTVKNMLKQTYDTDIEIRRNLKGKGNIIIAFKSDDEFERISEMLRK
ncbi:MAG: ParB/RepB/Spo0J family partition protein [Bacteroidales bacterium]|jgi:ParB family chromosome partitioning protein|nr:ParB/RepB/Spo0J family partition protein [Bacteroidales bacterium]